MQEPPITEPAKPDYGPTVDGTLRCLDTAPAFAVGERVRARDISPSGHTRLPRYVRGHVGVVDIIQPPGVLPDTDAHFLGENPQYVYSVRFDSHDLWGADAEPFELTVEMFESYRRVAGVGPAGRTVMPYSAFVGVESKSGVYGSRCSRSTVASRSANCMPRQARGPMPNGK